MEGYVCGRGWAQLQARQHRSGYVGRRRGVPESRGGTRARARYQGGKPGTNRKRWEQAGLQSRAEPARMCLPAAPSLPLLLGCHSPSYPSVSPPCRPACSPAPTLSTALRPAPFPPPHFPPAHRHRPLQLFCQPQLSLKSFQLHLPVRCRRPGATVQPALQDSKASRQQVNKMRRGTRERACAWGGQAGIGCCSEEDCW